MPLDATEQIVYDYIKSDPKRRDYWESQIKEIRRLYSDENDAADELKKRLVIIYNPMSGNLSEIEGIVGTADLVACRWITVAFKLMGRDLDEELRTAKNVIESYESEKWTHEKRRSEMMKGMLAMQASSNNQSLGEIFAADYSDNVLLPKIKKQSKYRRMLLIIWGISLILSSIITIFCIAFYINKNQTDFLDILKYGLLSVFFLTLLIGFIPGTLCQWSFKD